MKQVPNGSCRMVQPLQWRVGPAEGLGESPAEWVPATVPGAVQLDWARANSWPDWYVGEEHRRYRWMETKHWRYETTLSLPETLGEQQVVFCCDGIDYAWRVMLDGTELLAREGMFAPIRLDLTGRAHDGSVLAVEIKPAPSREGAKPGRDEADHSVKPPVAYGWDWHPRLVPLGIWEDAWLEFRPVCHIEDAEIRVVLADNLESATLSLRMELAGVSTVAKAGQIRWTLRDPGGATVWQETASVAPGRFRMERTLEAPQLWWPNGQGEQALYRSTMEWLTPEGTVRDVFVRRTGIRRVKLVMHPGAWEEPSSFPKTRSTPPMTLEINGRQIFAKGSNWLNPDVFPGAVDIETYRPLVSAAREAHFNIFRCWGGSFVDKEVFFDLCDEAGILIWQEFPLACCNYPDDPHYLSVLDAESRSIIRRLRNHPCLALWCGGNELFNEWSGMTDQSLPLRLLNRNTLEMDPFTPFIPTSPVMGMAHGGYSFVDFKSREEVFSIFPKNQNTAYTEFGISGPTPESVLRMFLSEEELFPPRKETPWGSHNGLGSEEPWSARWLALPMIEAYFGKPETLKELIQNGGWLQEEGYRFIFEEARRQAPTCSMAVNWSYNDSWTQAANGSLLAWKGVKKAGYFGAQSACRPVLASLANQRFTYAPGSLYESVVWLLNDSPETVPAGTIHVWAQAGNHRLEMGQWHFDALPPRTNRKGLCVSMQLPEDETLLGQPLVLHAEVQGYPEQSSTYRLLVRKPLTQPLF